MKRILIANRGEIAVRIVNACRNLGIESVAVYSDADAYSLHVLQADRAIRIGPPPASMSYLNQNSLVHVAVALNCDAIHPGYGFLSENPEFVKLCDRERIKFIGPLADSLRRMGDKVQARAEAVKIGIPVVPGSSKAFTESAPALEESKAIGYPVLIKARGGGGGRGMRVANSPMEFVSHFAQATKEAESAFGDAALYLENFQTAIRHVEVQILGDEHGDVIALGERDCTVQRRHQKLVEESPCFVIDDSVRNHLHQSAVQLGQAIGYQGAGTVEFILTDNRKQIFFIEMNTRIQVEHPVTELLFGVDLVEAQLRLAMGEKMSDVIGERSAVGHAMEFRINAEDWQSGFRPSPGTIRHWQLAAGAGIRVDTHIYELFRISPFYDSMIAKLIVHGHDRNHALERARDALRQFRIDGVKSTIGFHRELLDHPAFQSGEISTKWVENEFLPEK